MEEVSIKEEPDEQQNTNEEMILSDYHESIMSIDLQCTDEILWMDNIKSDFQKPKKKKSKKKLSLTPLAQAQLKTNASMSVPLNVSVTRECGCVVESLFNLPFSVRPYDNKKEIIEKGKPTPSLKTLKKQSKSGIRHFHDSWYSDHSWLCGCGKTNKLYCWPCLLFSSETNAWTEGGVHNLDTFRVLKRRHEISPAHVSSVAELIVFGKNETELCLSRAHKNNVENYNEGVKNNRYIMRNLIDAVCFLGKQDLAFKALCEDEDSDNRGNYKELLTLFAKRDDKCHHHLEMSTGFSGVSSQSNNIHNDIAEAISCFITNEIKVEIKEVNFVSIIIDETIDVSNKAQLSTVFRYVCPEGEVKERFLRFTNVIGNRSAVSLSEHIFDFLEEFNCGSKLVALSFDGATVMAEQHGELMKLVRGKCSQTLFVHCYAHKLYLVLQQSVDHIKECKDFFQTLSGLAVFFLKCPKRASALDKLIKKRLPTVVPTRWNYACRLVEDVSSLHPELVKFFKEMKDDTTEWDGETRMCAKGFYITLQEFDFNFLLNLFSLVLPKSEVLFETLQERIYDIAFCTKLIQELQELLQTVRDNFETVWSKLQGFEEIYEIPRKREKIDNVMDDKRILYHQLYFEIVDTLSTQISNRFSEIDKLEFLSLLDLETFKYYSVEFPNSAFESLVKSYGQKFDCSRLKTELSVLYAKPGHAQNNLCEFYQHLRITGLEKAFPESTKLAELLLSIPATSSSLERSFSASKRIETFQRNGHMHDRLSALSIICIEKTFLNKLMKKPSFYDSVTDIFDEKGATVSISNISDTLFLSIL